MRGSPASLSRLAKHGHQVEGVKGGQTGDGTDENNGMRGLIPNLKDAI